MKKQYLIIQAVILLGVFMAQISYMGMISTTSALSARDKAVAALGTAIKNDRIESLPDTIVFTNYWQKPIASRHYTNTKTTYNNG